jgi:uncharacterized protein YbjT (DUF2867 family)
MILITGATGVSGKPIVHQLMAAGAKFRVMARSPGKAREELGLSNDEIVPGDFSDKASVEHACRGIERVLLNSNASPQLVEQQSEFINIARRLGIKHVVKFSVSGASPRAKYTFGQWHGAIEEALKSSGMGWTMLQPTFFMQNSFAFAPSIKKSGQFHQPAGEGRAPYVDVRDIAAVAVKTLTESTHERKSYVITGPKDLTCKDIAKSIAKAIGEPVQYVDVPRETAKASMIQNGMPEWQAEAISELFDLLRKGQMAGPTNTVREVAKKEPFTFDQFARDHVSAFGA